MNIFFCHPQWKISVQTIQMLYLFFLVLERDVAIQRYLQIQYENINLNFHAWPNILLVFYSLFP